MTVTGTSTRRRFFNKQRTFLRLVALEDRAVPATMTVTNLNDSGAGSFRQAVLDANAANGADTIDLSGLAGTINLNGQVTITDTLAIVGPGASKLTLANVAAASTTSRVLNVNCGAAGASVTLSGLTLTGGKLSGGRGGAILVQNEHVTMTNVTITGNSTGGDGGGFASAQGGNTITMTNCIVSNNQAPGTKGQGGGIYFNTATSFTIRKSEISGNKSGEDGGGAYFHNGGTLLMEDCAVVGNRSSILSTGRGGGGMYFNGGSFNGTIRNCTISSNTASNGGGIIQRGGGILTIQNSTIVFNSATTNGGGIYDQSTETIVSTLIAKNTAANGPDVNGLFDANFCLFGSTTGATVTGANNITGIDPLLSPLGNNGGTTQTHALQPGSPAINKGSNPASLTTDQRGFARVVGSAADIGAFEAAAPIVNLASTASSLTNSNPIPVTVSFSQSVTGFDITDLTITNATASNFAGSGAAYSFDLSPSGQGAVSVQVAAGRAVDSSNNPNLASNSLNWVFDSVAPGVSLASSAAANTNSSKIPVTVSFTESVTGFDLSDLTITNATASNFAGSGAAYSLDLTPSGQGAVTVQVAAGRAGDAATNQNTASNLLSRVFDSVAPTASGNLPDVVSAGASSVTFAVTYSDALSAVNVSSLTDGDVHILGPNGFDVAAKLAGVDLPADGSTRVATYSFVPPGGFWNAADIGNYSVILQAGEVNDVLGNAVGLQSIATFAVGITPAKVANITINNGDVQRSRVTAIDVSFDQSVVLPANPADAFSLNRQSDNLVVNLAAISTGNTVTLTFTGGAVDFNSLKDGRYTLTVHASQVSGGDLDGDGNGLSGDDYTLIGDPATNKLFRLFGDANGDGTVAANDFIQFRLSLGGSNPIFDFDGDGAVAASDFIQFRLRFGGSI